MEGIDAGGKTEKVAVIAFAWCFRSGFSTVSLMICFLGFFDMECWGEEAVDEMLCARAFSRLPGMTDQFSQT